VLYFIIAVVFCGFHLDHVTTVGQSNEFPILKVLTF